MAAPASPTRKAWGPRWEFNALNLLSRFRTGKSVVFMLTASTSGLSAAFAATRHHAGLFTSFAITPVLRQTADALMRMRAEWQRMANLPPTLKLGKLLEVRGLPSLTLSVAMSPVAMQQLLLRGLPAINAVVRNFRTMADSYYALRPGLAKVPQLDIPAPLPARSVAPKLPALTAA